MIVNRVTPWLTLIVILLVVGCSLGPPPTDEALIETFKGQQSDFETLANMMIEDAAVEKVALSYTRPNNIGELDISEQRIWEYRRLLRKLDLLSVSRYRDGVSFTAYASGGFPDEGIYKGYEYFPGGLPSRHSSSVVDNLDKHFEEGTVLLFRQIDKHWYLFLLY